MQRKVCESINNTFAKNAAINFLSSNESFSGYQQKRLAQSFDQCEVSHPNKKRRINDSILEQYKDIVISKLSDWLQDKRINWSELGRLCGLNAKNRGQIVRDIAEESGIDTTNMHNKRDHLSLDHLRQNYLVMRYLFLLCPQYCLLREISKCCLTLVHLL